MKVTTVYATIWISCSVAISIGIFVTGSLVPLWGLLIPSFISLDSRAK